MENFIFALQNLGLDKKEAALYLSALELGPVTIQQLALKSRFPRTTIYNLIEKLLRSGFLIEAKKGRKTYYMAASPKIVLKQARERLEEFAEEAPKLEQIINKGTQKPKCYLLQGVAGFKQLWERILAKQQEYLIITEGKNFLDYVKEKYILREIIRRKKLLNIKSRQLIKDSDYARDIIDKDAKENRKSKLLPVNHPIPFTTVICEDFVAYASPRQENLILIIDNPLFTMTQRSLFEVLWNTLS
jgi:sugar-specific transcriptional regulator TrmB